MRISVPVNVGVALCALSMLFVAAVAEASGGRPPAATPGPSPAAPKPYVAPAAGGSAVPAAAAPVPVGIVGWLGPLPAMAPPEARRMAAEALARIDLPAVDDGETLRIAQSKEVARRYVYSDGRVVGAGTVTVVRDWVAKVVDAGTVDGKPWIALSIERAASPPAEDPPAPPAGAWVQLDAPPEPAFDSASLWLMQRAKVDRDDLCGKLGGLNAAVAPHAQNQCNQTWLAAPGSLKDPELLAIGDEVRTGFFAVQAGLAIPNSSRGLQALSQLQWFRTSRQTGWITSSRFEIGASYEDGMEIAGHMMLGLGFGGDSAGLAVLGGLGISGITNDRVDFGGEAVARLQGRARTSEGEVLVWFEPAWIAGGKRPNGSPTLPWADGLRAGLYYGRDGMGVHSTGVGAELWEVQGVRMVQVVVGLASCFGKW